MRILIAGGCGFVGSSLAVFLAEKYPHYKVLVFDNLIRRGSELNIPRLQKHGIALIKGDVRNRALVEALPKTDIIIDAAAEPSVLSGIDGDPTYVLETNFGGTINLMRLAKMHRTAILFLSTSRVYPFKSLNEIPYRESESRFEYAGSDESKGYSDQGISEEFEIVGPKSFYGASKFASENLLHEYQEFFQLRSIVNRFGVIAGPHQMGKVDQGIVMHWLSAHHWQKPLKYLGFGGQGKQVRDILHIDDACRLMDYQLHHLPEFTGKIWNVGGGKNNTVSLRELTKLCESVTGHSIPIGSDRITRPADVRIYYSDNHKVMEVSQWHPQKSVEICVHDTYAWLLKNQESLSKIYG